MTGSSRTGSKFVLRQWGVAVGASLLLAACATSPTGRKQLTLLPDSQMAQMGDQTFAQYKKEKPIERDAATNRYIRCITDALLPQAHDRTGVKNWEVVVFKDKEPNAFALPGGNIGVHTGLLRVAQTQGQVAAVIGHEIGHVIAEHGNERVSQGLLAQGSLAVVDAFISGQKVSDQTRSLIIGGLGLGAQIGVLLPFSRSHESEADEIGLDMMARAGFDPAEAVQLWKNMSKAGGGAPPQFLSTHPSNETRISNLERLQASARQDYSKAKAAGRMPSCRPPGMVFYN